MFSRWQASLSLVLTLVLLVLVGTGLGQGVQDRQQELDQVEDRITDTEQELQELRGEEEELLDELAELEDNLLETRQELENLKNEVEETEGRIAETEEELEEAEEELAYQEELLGQRLRALHENGSVTYLEVLLGATDFMDFLNRVDLMQEIIGQDVELLEAIQEAKEKIEAKKAELEEEKEKLVALQERTKEREEQLARDTARREEVLEEVQAERAGVEQQLDELEATSQQLEGEIRQLQAQQEAQSGSSGSSGGGGGGGSSAPSGGGAMQMPVSGSITSGFGYRTHPITGGQRMHSGIDIAAPSGQPIHAADSGTVIFSGWRGGYGNTVIIDHGGGISTLYAHNSSNLVSQGQAVSRGEQIARVGTTGFSTGPHVHFEVRVNGEPRNPMGWL